MERNKWWTIKNQSLAAYMRSAGFDLAVIEERPPGGFTLSAHVLDREQYLLTVLPDAEGNKVVALRGGC